MVYHWQQSQWQQLQAQIRAQRLAHALLLTGQEGLGKRQFAEQLAASLLCRHVDNNNQACGSCDACHLLAADTHPDMLRLEPEERGKAIKVDDVRSLCQTLSLTSQFSGYKVAIIDPAEQMNINAANSLLKTLEEPTAQTLLILVTASVDRLPVTIRSRCQTIHFQQPPQALSQQWLAEQGVEGDLALLLKLAHGSPLLAQMLADQALIEQRQSLMNALLGVAANKPVTGFSDALAKSSQAYLLGWLYDWISDLLKLHQLGDESGLVHIDLVQEMKRLVKLSRVESLFALLDEVIKLRQLQSIPLNAQMLWEDLLIEWGRAVK
ncbi:MAG: DNA polymerase III subunit delta' [Gammaproteobacteria bacterium]|nr:DNA polymerase III subunit delta' [Gammaproteobacteria bacterium]